MGAVAVLLVAGLGVWAGTSAVEAERARDRQDRGALEQIIAQLTIDAEKRPKDADAQYRLAMAQSYLAEVAMELRDKNQAKNVAEAGIEAARRAVALKPGEAEYHRILGVLCGQVIPANILAGLKYGKCAQDSVNKAVELNPKSSSAWLAHGVGNYYLPPALGGGVDAAIRDFEKATKLNPRSADAWLWLGIAFRKVNRVEEARQAFTKSLELNPNRVWAKQQLDKTPR